MCHIVSPNAGVLSELLLLIFATLMVERSYSQSRGKDPLIIKYTIHRIRLGRGGFFGTELCKNSAIA